MIMYGTRYILQFDSEKFGHEYKILIKEDGYSGPSENKSLGAAPLLRRDDSDSGISGTSLEMVIQADEDGELTSLYTVDNKKFLVELYKNSSLIWTGYVLPEKYSEPYVPVPYDVSVTASDGLGILKDIPFTLSGEKTLFEVTRFCCNQTGMTLDFIVFSSLVESSMNTGNSMLVQTSLDVSTFQDKTCYEVLESILTSLDAFITEANGKWVIARYTDLDKEGFLYSNAGKSSGKVSLEPRVLGNVHSELYPIGNLELEIEPANKSVKFTSDYDLRPSFLQNYDFSGGDSGWGGFEYVIAKRKGVGFAAMHGNSGKQERYIQQSVSVEKSSQAVVVEVKFALAQMFASMNGRAGEDREFALKIQLSGGGQTYYLSDEGWGTKDFRFPVHGSLQDMFWDRGISTNYVDDYESNFKVTADGFPASGQLTISIYNIYVEMSGTSNVRSSLFLSHVIVTNDYGSGIDVSVSLAEKASTSHEDVDICLTDVPFVENADKMFYNGLKVAGKYTSSWACGGKTDSFLYTILKSVCSRIGFPRKQLSGTIQGENLDSFMLLVDKYSDSLFQTREFSLNLLTDEMNVTLEQFMPYQELSGTATESPRVPGNNTSEYRSSGENETRVYQSGVGVPMRIRDLSPVELQADSVIEVDRANVAKSGKATLQKVLEFVLNNGKVWTEEKLKVVEGYILYLGEKIKAGDSDLWSGHSFDDYLDQAVKGDSDVKFKSVTSIDFKTKVKGWIIDALGDVEFRDVLLRSFKSWSFTSGPLGAGVGMVNDDELQTDKLLVRKIMYVLEMMVQRMRFQGGQMVLSPAAGFKVNSVEVFDTYYRLRCHPGDFNEFEVNDQARIQNFNGSDTKYLWSLVVAKGDDYIDISRVDKDGEGVPAVGDEIVQLGNRTNTNRQDAVLLSAANGEVGIFTYFGINSFDLSGKEGSWFGKHGDKKGAVIKGEVHVTAGSSGLEQFDEYEDIDERIQNAQDSANSVQEVVNNLTSIIIPDLQEQIDGSIMSWEGTVAPTMENEPAVNWTTEEERKRHIGDYYDYFLTVNEEQVTERYKFSKVNGTYQWVRVADSGSALAVSEARKALGLAGSKSAIIWSNSLPTPPYSINDMWVKEDGSMYICNTGRLDGETGSQSDWQLFNDTMLRLSKMADDNIITKEEKASIRDTWNQIQKEFASYQEQATTYGVSITALQNAYNALNTFLTSTVKIAIDEDTTLSVAQKTEYNQDFANYYSERTAFANVIAQKVADESVGNLQIGMVNLLKGSNVELNKQAYNLGYYGYDNKPEAGKTYTLVCCYTLGDSNTYIGAYSSNGGYHVGNLSKKGTRVVESITFTAKVTPTGNFDFYQFPNGTFCSTVHWAVLVEGNKGPNAWIPSFSEQGEAAAKNEVNNLQIGGINLADYSGGNFLNALGLYDSSYASKGMIDGKTCLIFNRNSANCRFAPVTVENGEYTFSIWVKGSEEYDAQVLHYDGSNYGATTVHVTTSWERKVITFTAKAGTDIIHWGTKNTIYIADWKYEKGNKVTDWSPSIADQNRYATEQGEAAAKDAVDNLQIGAVNLVSRKMLYDINNTTGCSAIWGQDSDGIYLGIMPLNGMVVYDKFKPNTQYVISVNLKGNPDSDDYWKPALAVEYTDGTRVVIYDIKNSVYTRKDYISEKGKSIKHLNWSVANRGQQYSIFIYDLAVYEGNKVLADIPPSFEDSVDNLQVGSVNLVSRKMMLAWNEKNKDIALWGQDSDGIYLAIEQKLLYENISSGSQRLDCFLGEGKYKANTQYVFQVKWKLAGGQTNNNSGVSFWALYTDGTTDGMRLGSLQTSLIVESFITKKGKTVEKIFSSYGDNKYRSRVYSLALYEGNKVLTEIPVATEDLQGQSNVNLVDGGKEVTVTAGASSTHAYKKLTVSKLKPNTVYHLSFKAENLVGSPTEYTALLYSKDISVRASNLLNSSSGGIMITNNNFTEGEYVLLLYAGVAGSTNGNSVKYTEVMLVEGFTPSSSYSPSPGDVQKEIEQSSTITKDDFAKEMGYESFQDMADKAVEKGGKLVVDGLLNANLIDVETLAANNAFINKLSTNILKAGSITASMLSVAGFTFENNNIYGGSKFGEGAGVNIVSDTSERSFKAYKDENNFVSMFYNSDTDWGLKGVVGSKTVFQLGNPDGKGTFIGPFNFTETQLVSSSDVTIGGTVYKQGFTLENNRLSFHRAVSSIYQRGIQMGVTNGTNYGADTLFAVEGGDIYHQGSVTTPKSDGGYTSRACKFYASDIIARGLLELKSHLIFNAGAYETAYPYEWIYSSNGTIPTAGRRLVYVSGNTGSDNPCTLGKTGAVDGQVITIINTSTSHRLNITGTAKGNHWILEGCCGTFRYLAGYGLWYPERFSW